MPQPRANRGIGLWSPPLALLALAVVLLLVQDLADPLTVALAGASTIVATVGAIQAVTGGLRPVAAATYIFWFAWLGIGPISQISIGRVAWGDTTILADKGRLHLALAMTAVAIAVFWVGDHTARRQAHHRSPGLPATIRPFFQTALSVALIGVGANAIRVLGLPSLFVTRQERESTLIEAGGSIDEVGGAAYALYTVLPSALAITVALLAIYRIQIRRRTGAGLRILDIAHLALGLAGVLLFANWLSQSRFIALMAFGASLIAVVRPRTARAGYVYLGMGVVVTLLIYPLANVFRYANTTVEEITEATFTSPDFDGFQQLVNTLEYVSVHGFSWGNELLSAVLFFIPRSIWPSKAETASVAIAEFAGYRFTNLSLPIHAELYLQFGWIGVVIGMFVLGFVASRFDNAWLDAPSSKMALMAPLVAMAMFGVLRGALGGQVPAYLPALLLLAVAIRSGQRDSNPHSVPRTSIANLSDSADAGRGIASA